MQNSIGSRCQTRVVRLLLLASLLVVTVAPTVPPTAPAVPAVATSVERVVGRGPLDAFACLGCAGVVVGLGGTTVLGVVGLLSAWPEIGIGCGLACYEAFR